MGGYEIEEAKRRLGKLIDRATAGEEVILLREGRPAVRLVPAEPATAQIAERAGTSERG